MREPKWARVDYGPIDYRDLYYYSAPKRNALASLDEVDPEILKTYAKLGIPLREQEMLAGVERQDGMRSRVAVDAVFDSVSVATTFQEELAKAGVLFMPISEALQKHPELVKKYLGTVVPISDNFFATLNSAVFSDGSFVYVPERSRSHDREGEGPCHSLFTTRRMKSIRWPSSWSRHGSFSHE